MDDRRVHERYTPNDYIAVIDAETRLPLGGLLNLSPVGAMFVTPGPVKQLTRYKCRVGLPVDVDGKSEVSFDAECLWSRKNVVAGRWESGYRLTMTHENEALVQYLLLTLKLDNPNPEAIPDVNTVEMSNRRESARHTFDEELGVYEQHSYRQIGVVGDLSGGGLRMITKRPISKGERLSCRVLLPDHLSTENYLLFEVECRWSKKGSIDDRFESGYLITAISDHDQAVLNRLLIRHGRVSQARRTVRVVS